MFFLEVTGVYCLHSVSFKFANFEPGAKLFRPWTKCLNLFVKLSVDAIVTVQYIVEIASTPHMQLAHSPR